MSRTQKQHHIFFLTLFCGGALLFFVGFSLFDAVSAQIPPGGLLPPCDFYGDPEHGRAAETYGLGAFVQLAANIMKLIWGIVGSLALLMFVWGGFQWLTAAGEESRVKAGWDTFINATIGIVIILGSWVIINTIMLFVINPQAGFKVADIFGQSWVTLATQDSICVNVAANARGAVPAPPPGVAASGSANVTSIYRAAYTSCNDLPGVQFLPEPANGQNCTIVCQNEARNRATATQSVAVDNAVHIPGKNCCCSFSVRAVGEGCGTNTPYREGTRGCAIDQYCDQRNPQQCRKKKPDGDTCGENYECVSEYCNVNANPKTCGQPISTVEGICCYNILKTGGIFGLSHDWSAEAIRAKDTECYAGSNKLSILNANMTTENIRFCKKTGTVPETRVCGEKKSVTGPAVSGYKWKKFPDNILQSNFPGVSCESR
jgi:hypothetical protein